MGEFKASILPINLLIPNLVVGFVSKYLNSCTVLNTLAVHASELSD